MSDRQFFAYDSTSYSLSVHSTGLFDRLVCTVPYTQAAYRQLHALDSECTRMVERFVRVDRTAARTDPRAETQAPPARRDTHAARQCCGDSRPSPPPRAAARRSARRYAYVARARSFRMRALAVRFVAIPLHARF